MAFVNLLEVRCNEQDGEIEHVSKFSDSKWNNEYREKRSVVGEKVFTYLNSDLPWV